MYFNSVVLIQSTTLPFIKVNFCRVNIRNKDGKEGEHKSKGEEEGEEADGNED